MLQQGLSQCFPQFHNLNDVWTRRGSLDGWRQQWMLGRAFLVVPTTIHDQVHQVSSSEFVLHGCFCLLTKSLVPIFLNLNVGETKYLLSVVNISSLCGKQTELWDQLFMTAALASKRVQRPCYAGERCMYVWWGMCISLCSRRHGGFTIETCCFGTVCGHVEYYTQGRSLLLCKVQAHPRHMWPPGRSICKDEDFEKTKSV